MTTETEKAFAGLLDEIAGTHRRMVQHLADDETTLLEAHKWILSILQVAAEVQLWADPARPRLVEIAGPYLKWGGDNADAFYGFAPIDPTRTYRITAWPGDAAYLSLTIYGGPNDGRYSERIVGTVNGRDATPGLDGSIRIVASSEPPREQGVAWLKLEPDAVAALTRDYLANPTTGRRATWHIEADDPPVTFSQNDSDLARRIRSMTTWVREQASIVPIPPRGRPTPSIPRIPCRRPPSAGPPAMRPTPWAPSSWATRRHSLSEVVRPTCVFWNMCLWNRLLHTYNYDYERVTINGAQVHYEEDGSWVIVVSAERPAHPNWVSTAGHAQRAHLVPLVPPAETPEQPQVEVLPVASVVKERPEPVRIDDLAEPRFS